MRITVETSKSYSCGKCIICSHYEVCKIIDTFKKTIPGNKVTFDCSHYKKEANQ